MFANNDDDSRLVLLLITHSHTYIHSHTHMFDSRSWVTDASFPHMDIVPARTHKNTNADCFVAQGCSQAIKRVCILDTLLQLASLNMQHTFTPMHAVAQHLSDTSVSHSLPLSFFLPWNLCAHQPDAASKSGSKGQPHTEKADIQAEAARHTGTQAKTLSISIILILCS